MSKLKFGTHTNSNMQNSMEMFTFSDQKHRFWVNLVQKIKIDSLSWNFVPLLIWKCKIQWWYSLLPFSTENTCFWSNLVQKLKIVSLSWYLVPRLIQICRIQKWIYFFCFQPEIPFLDKFGTNNKNYQFSWNSVLRLIRVWKIQW